ncbi:MAG TPA: hypothetical protein VFU63_15085 [Ktedonobacterales bacterium]|nr:hypothetical protein [Ktedonobacterales bacterium]
MATNEPMTNERQAFAVAGFRSVFDQRFLFADEQRRIVELAERLLAENQRLSAREQALADENAAHREHIASLISQLSDCEAKRDADLEQRLALATEIAAMRPMVEAMAAGAEYASNLRDMFHCLWCDGEDVEQRDVQHDNNCFVTQARAFVATHPTAGKAESEGE